jgi:hypothetical protein
MKFHFKTSGTFCALLLNPSNAKEQPPRARELCGVIQAIDLQTRTLTVQLFKRRQPATFAVKSNSKFIKDSKSADSASLRAWVYYGSPFFGKPFVTKAVWVNQNQTCKRL